MDVGGCSAGKRVASDIGSLSGSPLKVSESGNSGLGHSPKSIPVNGHTFNLSIGCNEL